MTYFIIGGSSGLGKAIAYELASKGKDIIIFSRDKRDMNAISQDIFIKHKNKIRFFQLDAHKFDIDSFKFLLLKIKKISGIFFPIGFSSELDNLQNSNNQSLALIDSNFTIIVKILELCKPKLIKSNSTVVGFGSVASIRGRTKNAIYAASKKALYSYFQSLMHFYGNNGKVNIQFYTLGYISTNLSFSYHLLFPKGDTTRLSKKIVSNLKSGTKFCYYPFFWKFLSYIIRILPSFIFNKVKN